MPYSMYMREKWQYFGYGSYYILHISDEEICLENSYKNSIDNNFYKTYT